MVRTLFIWFKQKILGRQTDVSSVTYRSTALVSVAVTGPLFIHHFNQLYYATLKWSDRLSQWQSVRTR